MEQHYTMEEVLQFTINILSNIRVPGAYMKDVGMPIMNALDNLMAMQTAMNAPKKTEENDEREADPE